MTKQIPAEKLNGACLVRTEARRLDVCWSWSGGKRGSANIWQLTQGAGAALRGDTSGPKHSSL